jgi:hypothetical protein
MRDFILPAVISAGLSAALSVVYLVSLPRQMYVETGPRNSVAWQLGRVPYFQSDGAFILHQYRTGSSVTHNDHLAYHVAARRLHRGLFPDDDTAAHMTLGVLAGGAGVGVLVLAGFQATRQLLPSILAALLVAGGASYWFFSASIDTYVPGLLWSIVALAAAIWCVHTQRKSCYVALGTAAGLAFLFRTDAVLLAPLIVAVVGAREGRLERILLCGAPAALVGGVGYSLLANYSYGVPFSDVWSFATGSLDRAPARSGVWGTFDNVTTGNLVVTTANQYLYGLILPGLTLTRSRDVLGAMFSSDSGVVATLLYTAFVVLAFLEIARRTLRADSHLRLLVLLGAVCVLTRLGFYTWWDPHDPFLFATNGIPSIWLFSILPFHADTRHPPAPSGVSLNVRLLTLLAVLVAVVWWHNLHQLIFAVWSMRPAA